MGFKGDNITYVPVSAITGENLTETGSGSKNMPWYSGPSLVECLENIKIPKRDVGGFVRFTISDWFKDQGCLVVGKLEKGILYKNKNYMLMPSMKEFKVSGIEDEDGDVLEVASAGDNCKLFVDEVIFEDIREGNVICDLNYPCETARSIVVKFMVVEHPSVLSCGFCPMIHINTTAVQGTVSKIIAILDPKTGKMAEKMPKFQKVGQWALIQIDLAKDICCNEFAKEGFMGRVLMRFEQITVGVGQIVKLRYEDALTSVSSAK